MCDDPITLRAGPREHGGQVGRVEGGRDLRRTHHRPGLSSVITGGESLVSHAGGTLLVETVRRSGLARELSPRWPTLVWSRPSTC